MPITIHACRHQFQRLASLPLNPMTLRWVATRFRMTPDQLADDLIMREREATREEIAANGGSDVPIEDRVMQHCCLDIPSERSDIRQQIAAFVAEPPTSVGFPVVIGASAVCAESPVTLDDLRFLAARTGATEAVYLDMLLCYAILHAEVEIASNGGVDPRRHRDRDVRYIDELSADEFANIQHQLKIESERLDEAD